MREFESLSHAYHEYLTQLGKDPSYTNSPRGFASKEEIGVTFKISDPLRRVITNPRRQSNIVFNFAEALWYLAGRDDLEYLAYYAPRIANYSADGVRLTGTAYGPRIFRYGSDGTDQWASVRRTLRGDPDSKRAVVQIFRVDELLIDGNIDVSCTLALQFLIREDRLQLVTFMRANDAYRGMVSDIFSFTFLQEVMARQLGLELGPYTHMVGSLHLYEPDEASALKVISHTENWDDDDTMPARPPGDPFPPIDRLLKVEEDLRLNARRLDEDAIRRLDFPEYWRQVAAVFEVYRWVRHGNGDAREVMNYLHPIYRNMLRERFPSLSRETL